MGYTNATILWWNVNRKDNLNDNYNVKAVKIQYKKDRTKYFIWESIRYNLGSQDFWHGSKIFFVVKIFQLSRSFKNSSHGSEYLSSNFSVNSFSTSRAVEIFDSMAVGKLFLDKVRKLYVMGTLSADR